MSSFETAYDASTATFEAVTMPSTPMTTISRLASTYSNTPASEFSKPLSPTAIGLLCGLGSCGFLGFFIWAVIYFRTNPPGVVVPVATEAGEARFRDEAMTEEKKNSKKSGRSNAERGVLLHDASGVSTARPSTDGDAYPSVGIAVNTALEREILDFLEAELAIRAMSRMTARA